MSHCKHIMNIKKKIWLDRKTEFCCFFGFLLQPCFSCFFPFNSKFPSPTPPLFILQPCFILVFLPSFPFSFPLPLSLPLPLFFHSPSFDFFLTFWWPWYGGGDTKLYTPWYYHLTTIKLTIILIYNIEMLVGLSLFPPRSLIDTLFPQYQAILFLIIFFLFYQISLVAREGFLFTSSLFPSKRKYRRGKHFKLSTRSKQLLLLYCDSLVKSQKSGPTFSTALLE